MFQGLGQIFNQNPGNVNANQNIPQQNNANAGGRNIGIMSNVKSAISNAVSALPSPSSFSFKEKVEMAAVGTIYLSQKAFAMANATNGSEPIPNEGGNSESGWPAWKIGLTVVGVTAGVVGIPLTAYCAYQNKERLFSSEHQPIPSDPNNADPKDKELEEMSQKGADEAAMASSTGQPSDVKEPSQSDPLLKAQEEKVAEDDDEIPSVKVTSGDDQPLSGELSEVPLSPAAEINIQTANT